MRERGYYWVQLWTRIDGWDEPEVWFWDAEYPLLGEPRQRHLPGGLAERPRPLRPPHPAYLSVRCQ